MNAAEQLEREQQRRDRAKALEAQRDLAARALDSRLKVKVEVAIPWGEVRQLIVEEWGLPRDAKIVVTHVLGKGREGQEIVSSTDCVATWSAYQPRDT